MVLSSYDVPGSEKDQTDSLEGATGLNCAQFENPEPGTRNPEPGTRNPASLAFHI